VRFEDVSKGSFPHFTLKEIYDQPSAVRQALSSRIIEGYGSVSFDELIIDPYQLMGIDRVLIIACGSSLHAGYIAKILMEDWARLPVDVEIASEYRYRNPIVSPKTLVIVISQSGETADTLAAMREVQAKGVKVMALCNVSSSSIVREADASILLRAGPEIGVCSTKAFTNQLVVLSLLSLLIARMRHMSKASGIQYINQFRCLPELIEQLLANVQEIERLAKKFASFDHAFFLGRNYMFPAALEGALKLKEIAYVNATGYPAGEMKHGPIALIAPSCFTVALCTNSLTYDKLVSNLSEVKARRGPILAVGWEGQHELSRLTEDLIYLPKTADEFAPILAVIFSQLFAYYIAKERGADIDQPRNLAKSVTVE
jgi:glucosamine--fructose-6-phosphate aminotransferase (isomerizing)